MGAKPLRVGNGIWQSPSLCLPPDTTIMTGSNSTPKAAGRDSELKELAITAIKQHPNYRGKPLGRLPYIIDKLVSIYYYL